MFLFVLFLAYKHKQTHSTHTRMSMCTLNEDNIIFSVAPVKKNENGKKNVNSSIRNFININIVLMGVGGLRRRKYIEERFNVEDRRVFFLRLFIYVDVKCRLKKARDTTTVGDE